MKKKEYLKKCEELLEYFGKDVSKDTIYLHSGDHSCIMNPNGKFYDNFGGHSISAVASFYAKETNKKIKFKDDFNNKTERGILK